MKKRRISGFTLVLALTAALSLGFVTAPAAMVEVNAATVDFDWENGVLDSSLGTFTFDVFVGGTGTVDDLDGWNLTFDITRLTNPGADFSFHFINIENEPNYVFYGIGDGYFTYLDGGPTAYTFSASDIIKTGNTPVPDPEGKLLARLVLDEVKYCEWFTITLDEAGSFYVDPDLNIESLSGAFDVHVVPIPGAVLLLGSGALCLIGLRRRQAG